jgi:hypothetical protein
MVRKRHDEASAAALAPAREVASEVSAGIDAHASRVRPVGVREFRDHASRYLAGDEILAVERHGRTIGYYVPVATPPLEEARRALDQLQQILAQVVASGRITEDELERVFDLSRPWPDPAEDDAPAMP